MDHIRQFDWCTTEPDINFLSESDIDNCVIEKILKNKFHDPLVYSESEDEDKPKFKLDWDEIFSKRKIEREFSMVVQGIHPVPPFTKLSALTGVQHFQCLKVLCSQYPDVLPEAKIPRPTKYDYKIFEQCKSTYEEEQKEFIEWAKSLWTSDHCVRALRPKPPIEMTYEAEFKVRAHSLESFPKNYALAAQIPLEPPNAVCDLVHQKDIIKVNVSSLPQIKYPDMTKKISIMKPCPVPEPCNKHPCRFILPTENNMTVLPLTETHRELAQFASDNGATAIASENALQCLVQNARFWTIPVSVCQVITADGDSNNVVVLGSEFSIHREPARIRTYKAFRRLLENTLVPPLEAHLANKRRDAVNTKKTSNITTTTEESDSDDDDNDRLFIDTDAIDDEEMKDETVEEEIKSPRRSVRKAKEANSSPKEATNKIDFYNCTCKDTSFEKPPLRSYRKWRVRNNAVGESYDFIVHCPHRQRNQSAELVLEPIPEYQLDLGGSASTPDSNRRAALALMLRKNAQVLNIRIDIASGEIVTVEGVPPDIVKSVESDINRRLFAAMDQLRGLLPGNYLLRHEPGHGSNALLYNARNGGELSLSFDCSQLAEADEAKSVKSPPTLTPVLLPMHKHRKILPCAFTPHQSQLAREPRRPAAKQKLPPQAIKWPKKKKKKKNSKNNSN